MSYAAFFRTVKPIPAMRDPLPGASRKQLIAQPSNSAKFHTNQHNSTQFRACQTIPRKLNNSAQFRAIPHNSVLLRTIPRNSTQFCTILRNSVQQNFK